MTTTNAPTGDDLKATMAEVLSVDVERLADDAVLTDLVTSSFLLVEMIIDAQEEYGIRFNQEQMQDVKTVGDLVTLFLETQKSSA